MPREPHDPYVMPYCDIADEWVARCDCGCGLYERHADRADADHAVQDARQQEGGGG